LREYCFIVKSGFPEELYYEANIYNFSAVNLDGFGFRAVPGQFRLGFPIVKLHQ